MENLGKFPFAGALQAFAAIALIANDRLMQPSVPLRLHFICRSCGSVVKDLPEAGPGAAAIQAPAPKVWPANKYTKVHAELSASSLLVLG